MLESCNAGKGVGAPVEDVGFGDHRAIVGVGAVDGDLMASFGGAEKAGGAIIGEFVGGAVAVFPGGHANFKLQMGWHSKCHCLACGFIFTWKA
jgi:hypothetical protein